MKERMTALWAWIRAHRRLSIALALALVVASVGTAYIISQLPPPRGEECGQITYAFVERDPAVRAASMQVLACFWHAYQHCLPATIILSFPAVVDTGGNDTLTVERRGSGCDVYDSRNEIVDGTNHHRTFRCASMIQQGDNLHLSGCDDRYLRSLDIQPIILNFGLCGQLGIANSDPSPAEAEQCFASAYSLCATAMLTYMLERFSIQDNCVIAYFIFDQGQGTCNSLALRQDGLHFIHCGSEGDIVVPAMLPTSQPTPVGTVPTPRRVK